MMEAESDNRPQSDVQSLLTLLADTTGIESRRIMVDKLMELMPVGDHPAIHIEMVSDPSVRMKLREKYETIMDELKLIHDWKRTIQNNPDEPDLEVGSYLLSRLFGNRDDSLEAFGKRLQQLSDPVAERLQLIHSDDHEGRIRALTHYLFEEAGFAGNTQDYYNPENSFITRVLETKKGIPVSLSVLVILIARRIGLPINGINLPGHFIVQYSHPDYSIYLDPFNKGTTLTEDECYQFLNWQGIEPLRAYLNQTGDAAILIRMYRNLINHYSARGVARMENILRQHFNLLQDVYLSS